MAENICFVKDCIKCCQTPSKSHKMAKRAKHFICQQYHYLLMIINPLYSVECCCNLLPCDHSLWLFLYLNFLLHNYWMSLNLNFVIVLQMSTSVQTNLRSINNDPFYSVCLNECSVKVPELSWLCHLILVPSLLEVYIYWCHSNFDG